MLSKKNLSQHKTGYRSIAHLLLARIQKLIKPLILTCRNNNLYYILFSTFGFLILLFFLNQNTKTLLAAWVILTASHFFILKNAKAAIFLSYLTSTAIVIGKSYAIPIIDSQFVDSVLHPDGIFQFVTISISDILICIMLFILARDAFVKKRVGFKRPPLPIIFLIIYVLCCFVSALIFSNNQSLSIIYAFQSSEILVAVLFARQYIVRDKLSLLYIHPLLLGMLFFESVIAFLQFIKNSVIGSSLEVLTEMTAQSSIGEDPFRTRPMGTFWHANAFADWLLPMIFLSFGYLYITRGKKTLFTLFITCLGCVALVITQSRSAWISFFILIFPFLYLLEKRMHNYIVISRRTIYIFFAFGICCLIGAMFIVPERLVQTIYLFEQNASGWSRVEQIKEWFNLILQYPLFGVGQGMSLSEVFFAKLRGRTDALYFLPTVVHNVYFIVMSETGVISLLSLLGYFYTTIRNFINTLIAHNKYPTIVQLSCLFGITAVAINYAFQPYNSFNQLIIFSTIFLSGYKISFFEKERSFKTV